MQARRYTFVIADRQTGAVRRLTISLWPTLGAIAGALCAAGADRPRRAVERVGDDCRSADDQRRAAGRERQLSRSDRPARRPDLRAADGGRPARRTRGGRSEREPRDGQAARDREVARHGRRPPRRALAASMLGARLDRCRAWRAERAARRDRQPARLGARQRRAPPRAGRGDAVGLAGRRLAHVVVRQRARIPSPRTRTSIPASTSPPTTASRSSPPAMPRSARPAPTAPTATW